VTEQTIGNHLRRLRFDHDQMSQAALAKIVGVTRQTIVALETGRYAPSLELAMRLAAVFGLGVDDIFHWTDPDKAAAKFRRKKGGDNG
jgi:putative transcriptional regulator